MPGYEWLSKSVTVAILAGFSSVILVMLLGQSRVFYSMSQRRPGAADLLAPCIRRCRTPLQVEHRSSSSSRRLFAAFVPGDIVGEMTSIGTLFAFMLVCAGVWIMRRRRPDLAARLHGAGAAGGRASLGIVVCGAMIFGLGWTNWLRLIVWLAIGLVFYFALRREAQQARRRLRSCRDSTPLAAHGPDRWMGWRLVALLITVVTLVGTAGYMLIEGWSLIGRLLHDGRSRSRRRATSRSTRCRRPGRPVHRRRSVHRRGLVLLRVHAFHGAAQPGDPAGAAGSASGSRGCSTTSPTTSFSAATGGWGDHRPRVRAPAACRSSIIERERRARARGDGSRIPRGGGRTPRTRTCCGACGIERARGLVAAVSTDAENVYAVLSARLLKPDLFIVGRAESEDARTKLKRAGADRVISPHHLGGLQLAQTALRPAVVDFVQLATSSENMNLNLEQVHIGAGSPLDGCGA